MNPHVPSLTPDQHSQLDLLWRVIRNQLRHSFVAKNEIIDLLILCVVAGEHLLLLGPPGTAKSALIQRFVRLIDARSFEYLLTRFTEPNEIFGPVDIPLFTENKRYRRLTTGMLPEANIVFLDEIFKANSAILNTLLTVMNERIFYNGAEDGELGMKAQRLPLISIFGASNELPDDPELLALVDRFAVRVATGNVPEEETRNMLVRGWELEQERETLQRGQLNALIQPEQIQALGKLIGRVDTSGVIEPLLRFVALVRAQGFELSDRRAVRLLRLAAASALLLRRTARCQLEDLWVLRHAWTHPQEAETFEKLVREVAGDAVLRSEERRALEDIEKDLQSQQALLPSRTTDAERLAALHHLHRVGGELEKHPGNAQKRQLLQKTVNQLTENLLAGMAAAAP